MSKMANNNPLISRIDLLSLRLLVAAVEEGNLARAADRENIAISGVSRRISDLEQRWGVQLLHRHDRGVKPTAACNAILPKLGSMFQELEDIATDIAAFGSGTRGLIRIHANMTAIAGDLASHIAQFSAANPEIQVEIEETTSLNSIQSVRSQRCDIGIVSDTMQTDDLQFIPWIDDELVAVMPIGHALAIKPSLSFEEVIDYPFIGMQDESALQILYRKKAEQLGHEIDERAHVTSFVAAKTLIASGFGVSILPRIALKNAGQSNLSIRPLSEPWAHRKVSLCVRHLPLPPPLQAFVKFLKT